MRISSEMIGDYQRKMLERTSERMWETQEKVTTGKKFSHPSDDPAATKQALELKHRLHQRQVNLRNIDSGRSALERVQSSLTALNSHLLDARDTAIAAVSPVTDQGTRVVMAGEIDQIIEALAQDANSQSTGRYLFGGTQTLRPPFVFERNNHGQITSASYQGNHELQKLPGQANLALNIPGEQIFAAPFEHLLALRDLLQNQDNLPEDQQLQQISAALEPLQLALDQNASTTAQTGNRQAFLEEETLVQQEGEQQEIAALSRLEDIDLPSALIQMWASEDSYRSVLYVTSRRNNNGGLLDFMA